MASNYPGVIDVWGNTLSHNWDGIVLYRDSNRMCGFYGDGSCTLVNPSVYTLASCKANITASSTPSQTPDYFDNCQWKTQNVCLSSWQHGELQPEHLARRRVFGGGGHLRLGQLQ
jgi:hypothetical protein